MAKGDNTATAIRKNDGPTAERKAKGDTSYAGLGRSDRIYSVVTPLDRLRRAGDEDGITGQMYEAGRKYALHWFQSGMAGNVHAIDLDRVGGSGDCTYGMPANEFQAHHRAEYRRAVRALGKWRSSEFEAFVCHEKPLSEIGMQMGIANKPQAIAAAKEMLRGRLHTLCELWFLTS